MLSFLEDAVEGIIKQIFDQSNIIDQLVMAVIKGFVDKVLGGAWKGKGADAFVNEMTSQFMPQIDGVKEALGGGAGVATQIRKAADAIKNADSQARSIVNGIADVFGNIF